MCECDLCKYYRKENDYCGYSDMGNGDVRYAPCYRTQYEEGYADGQRDWMEWIPVTEVLPEEGEPVIVCSQYGEICIVELVKGISEETRKKMKNGEIDDPCEKLWCLSDGYTMSKRSDLYKEGDEFGNNQKDYAWINGPYHYSGQDFIAWMPLPVPYRGEHE